jgi:hypothetical protein
LAADGHDDDSAGRPDGAGAPASSTPASEVPRYDAFISYSHTARSNQIAQALQRGLERFARPWYRPRAARIFRDTTNLSVSPHLWADIETALGRSHWFILLASPQAAASRWVDREVEWWLETARSIGSCRCLPRALCAGGSPIPSTRSWRMRGSRWSRSAAVPAGELLRRTLRVDRPHGSGRPHADLRRAASPPSACRVCLALQHSAAASSPPAAPASPGMARRRAGSGQDPSSTSPWRADQPVRTRSLKPLVNDYGRVLTPHRVTS